MTEPLATLSTKMIRAVEDDMRAVLNSHGAAGDLFFGMMHYHMGWVSEELSPIQSSSGKRVRPLLCLLVCQSAGGNWEQAIPAAASLELLHNFTLIHDDIQDASPTRRGRKTLWNIWGANQAINSGDAMFAFAHIAMSRLSEREVPDSKVVRALRRLDETCIDLTVGQYSDMHFEHRTLVSVQEYLDMIGGKTAALIALSAELGAVVAGCDPRTTQHYANFGRDLGYAFQVRDDILGIWGDESVIGKSAATDIITRKKSLPVLYGLEQSEALHHLYAETGVDPGFVGKVVALLDEVGALSFAQEHEARYSASALHELDRAAPSGRAAVALRQLTDRLLNRQS